MEKTTKTKTETKLSTSAIARLLGENVHRGGKPRPKNCDECELWKIRCSSDICYGCKRIKENLR